MSKDLELIRKYLRDICDADVHEIYQGTVQAVNSDGTIDVLVDGEVVMPGIRLRVVTGATNGIVATPALNANVVYAAIERGQDYQLISASNISRLYIRAGNTILDITSDAITMNEGNNGGLVKVVELTQKLATLESRYNTLLQALNNTIIPLAPTGTVPLAPFIEAAQAITPVTQRADIENLKVKQ